MIRRSLLARLAGSLLCAAAWAAAQSPVAGFRLELPEASGYGFPSGAVIDMPRAPVHVVRLHVSPDFASTIEPGHIHIRFGSDAAEVATQVLPEGLLATARRRDEGPLTDGDLLIVKSYVLEQGRRELPQEWTVRFTDGIFTTASTGESPLSLRLTAPAERPILWSGEQSVEVRISGALSPANAVSRFAAGGVELSIPPGARRWTFDTTVHAKRGDREIVIEALGGDSEAVVIIPLDVQGL